MVELREANSWVLQNEIELRFRKHRKYLLSIFITDIAMALEIVVKSMMWFLAS
jgi:hypothetical protein